MSESRNISPRRAHANIMGCLVSQAKCSRDARDCAVSVVGVKLLANLAHSVYREFRRAIFLTTHLRAMTNLIRNVLVARTPLQVICMIVVGVAIHVATFHAAGAWANKCVQHKGVDVLFGLHLAATVKPNSQMIPALPRASRACPENAPSSYVGSLRVAAQMIDTAHSTATADFIKPFVTDDGTPLFRHRGILHV